MEMRLLRDKATEAFAKGRFSKAAEFYEEYCKGEPKDYQARLRMGDAWAKAGQRDRAISAYQLAATGFAREGFLPRAIAASKLILELDPAHKGVQQMLADLYARKSAGGNGVPQRQVAPARRVELPSFTENMGMSMGPAAAPLELPEHEELEIPVHAPLEIPVHAPLKTPEAPPAAQAALDQQLEIPVHAPLEFQDTPPAVRARPVPAQQTTEIPVHAPLEIPDAPEVKSARIAQQTEIPVHAPLEMPEDEQLIVVEEEEDEALVVVRGVAVPPTPAPPSAAAPSAVPPAQAKARPPPPPPVAPAPSVSAPAPRPQPQPQAPAVASPPGLAPRPAEPRAPTPASPAQAAPPRAAPPASPPVAAPSQGNAVASPDETALEVDLGRGTKKLAWAALSEPLFPAGPSAGASPSPASAAPAPGGPAPAAPAPGTPAFSSAAPPGLRPRRSGEAGGPDLSVTPTPGHSAVVVPPSPASASATAFTELELEPDTLLHAVEEAALSGMKQRAASTPGAAVQPEEEEIISLTEEVDAGAQLVDALPTIPLFSDLPREAFIEVFERCPLRHFSTGERVFAQGSHGDAFYVICEGSVRVFRQEGEQRKELATLASGAFFGEMALLSGAPRMASVESAADDTQLLEISAPVLAELSRLHPQVARALKKFCRERMLSNVMSTSALFEPFNRKDRRSLVEKFRAREVKKNELIVREGENTDGLYVVLSGEVEARKGDQVLARLKEGELFGEISLLSKTPATATVTATRRTSLLRLPREDFDGLILTHPQILVLVSELSEQRQRRSEALTGEQVIELTAEELLV